MRDHRACHQLLGQQRLGPRLDQREGIQQPGLEVALGELEALEERRVGRVDQTQRVAAEERAVVAALAFDRLFEPLHPLGSLGEAFLHLLPRLGVVDAAQRLGEVRHEIGPGAVAGTIDRILGMQPGRHHLVEEFGDRVGFEERLVLDDENRDLAVRRNLEEPVGLLAEIDVGYVELDLFGAHQDHGALHPGSGERADQVVFLGHSVPPSGACGGPSRKIGRASLAVKTQAAGA